ncbi:alpha/beta hydrolase [Agrobacterium rubi]|uniref:Alpha/beta hydrolase n=3 Tax=Agrobacterium rubi TaxID=28099 RepID=A0AAE7R888_9HYPH|nr:alpha/beta hydrolase [Agrobacterium rubi]NTF05587.1 alpha/beta hydrolase [Agrobacterium rubi]NTF10874.1 alpha/beta hydrolase [Agrobacterium rubi]NTF21119.1 alpha/beta hydrolase [Agrobacterium rubi]NTF30210.1 alpha/beta hydrolase [Agrobacterium rubi]
MQRLNPGTSVRLRSYAILAVTTVMMLVTGCTSVREPYSQADADKAQIVGFENVRVPLDANISAFIENKIQRRAGKARYKFLAISGGGAGGAFSVGVLKAWTERGDRPTFDIVTGVSTGALIAPFAFLGSKYDDVLEHLYTSGVAAELIDKKFIVRGLLGESLYYQKPLKNMVERYVDRALLNEISTEYRKGRDLFVLTTNLDTQRAVLWDMGAIASSPRSDALDLFRTVMIASASIPGAFPAVQINAVVDGRQIIEMHSDGGPSAQIITVPEALLSDVSLPIPKGVAGSDMYLLINNALMPEFSATTNSTLSVSTRAYSILVKSQTRQSLYAAYEYCRRVGIGFHMASIDVSVPYDINDPFNNTYMRAVYKVGREKILSGQAWQDRPIFPELTSK